jgi:hypothetical protein
VREVKAMTDILKRARSTKSADEASEGFSEEELTAP